MLEGGAGGWEKRGGREKSAKGCAIVTPQTLNRRQQKLIAHQEKDHVAREKHGQAPCGQGGVGNSPERHTKTKR